jgi:hypothetical protein
VFVSAQVGAGSVVAVLGAILLVVAICLIVGAIKVSNTFTVYQLYDTSPRRKLNGDNIVKSPVPGSNPGTDSLGANVLFKTHIHFYKGLYRQVNVRSAQSANSYLGPSA